VLIGSIETPFWPGHYHYCIRSPSIFVAIEKQKDEDGGEYEIFQTESEV
jgi:hypothetical protein